MNRPKLVHHSLGSRFSFASGALIFTVFTASCGTTEGNNASAGADAGADAGRADSGASLGDAASPDSTSGLGTQDLTAEIADGGSSSGETSNASFDAGFTGESTSGELSSVADAAVDAAVEPIAAGVPPVNTSLDELDLDVFGTNQNHYWFIATSEQIYDLNREFESRGGYNQDQYTPGDDPTGGLTIDHLVVSTPDGQTADFGEMDVKLVGQSTGRSWTSRTLPNFKVDSDDVTPNTLIGGFEHLRFNNAVVGTIFREKFVYDYYRTLGYPAPQATYGWVSSSAWRPETKVPYVVVESYKRGFCKERLDYFGGECPNMWEFASDFGWGYGYDNSVFDYPENCQFESCDSSRAKLFEDAVVSARNQQATLEDVGKYVDWQRFHEFQCLSWIFGTSDDPIHGGNNTVWVERPDGKFQLLPYSIDISLSLPGWGGYEVSLNGSTSVASLCQSDAGCWEDTLDVCGGLVDAFIAADPVARIDALHAELDEAGMLRDGDEEQYASLRGTLESLVTRLPVSLENYRENGVPCSYPFVACDGMCKYPADCSACQDEGDTGSTTGGTGTSPDTMTGTTGTYPDTGSTDGTGGTETYPSGETTIGDAGAGETTTVTDGSWSTTTGTDATTTSGVVALGPALDAIVIVKPGDPVPQPDPVPTLPPIPVGDGGVPTDDGKPYYCYGNGYPVPGPGPKPLPEPMPIDIKQADLYYVR